MIPLIAADMAMKDIGKGDKGTIMPVINIVNKQVKIGLIITVSVIGAIALFYGGRAVVWSIQKKNALKNKEAKSALKIYDILKPALPLNFWAYLNPITGLPTLLKDVGAIIVKKVADAFSSGSAEYLEIKGLFVYNVDELIKTYHGLYRRDLLVDMKATLSEADFNTIVNAWKAVDINRTGFGFYDGNISVKEGNKINTYQFGQNSSYANKYGLIVSNGKGKLVTYAGGAMQLKDINFVKGNYAGISKSIKLGNTTYSGGWVVRNASDAAIMMITKINGNETFVYVPIGSVILFDTIADMNAYATDKGIGVTSVRG